MNQTPSPRRQSTKRLAAVAGALTAAAMLVSSTTALAQDEPDHSTSAQNVVQGVNEVENVELGVPLDETAEGFTAVTVDAEVAIPSDADDALVLTSNDGATLSIGLPGNSDGVAVGDSVIFEDAAVDTSVVAKVTEDGGAQVLVVLESADAPKTVPFPIDGPEGARLEQNSDGSVTVLLDEVLGDGEATLSTEIGSIAAPWAFDANGEAVPTSYTVDGMTLIQNIDTDETMAFPVTADPSTSTGWGGLYIQWTRAEALFINGLAITGVSAFAGSFCSLITAFIGSALCAAAAASLWYTARYLTDFQINQKYDEGCELETRVIDQNTSWKC